MMQWRYVTANSCIPKGYLDESLGLGERGWLRSPGMAVRKPITLNYYVVSFVSQRFTILIQQCADPLDPTGARTTGNPEQFWNCAEITIVPSDTPIVSFHNSAFHRLLKQNVQI
jgi:hypothetical protein